MPIDQNTWLQRAQPQRLGRNWCWAASLSSIARYLVNADILQEDFIQFAFGTTQTDQKPDWGAYMIICDRLMDQGIEYSRDGHSRRLLRFDLDLENGFNHALAIREIQASRPVIVTIEGGDHDLVVIDLTIVGTAVTAVRYWNPGDNGIGDLTIQSFNGLNVLCTLAVQVNPQMAQIPFVSGGFL